MGFDEAMKELHIRDDAEPIAKLKAACQWHLGDAAWAHAFIGWAELAGYTVIKRQSHDGSKDHG